MVLVICKSNCNVSETKRCRKHIRSTKLDMFKTLAHAVHAIAGSLRNGCPHKSYVHICSSHHCSLEGEVVNPSLEICNSLPGFLQLVLQGAVVIRLGLGKGLMWDGSCRRLSIGSQMLLGVHPGSRWTAFTTAWRELERLQYSFP